jgi:protein-S-isoprenylcysteine O-methyltransferase Ste14
VGEGMPGGVDHPRRGNAVVSRLARLRVSLGFAFGVLVFWLAHPTATTLAGGIPVAIIGEMLRVWASGHLNKSREVTSSGPYRWVAHPLYVGSSVMGAGLAIASGSGTVAVLVVVYLAATLTAAIKSEEAFLRNSFGDRYDRYRRGDAASADDGGRRFAVSQVFANREHRAIVGLIAAVLLLVLKATYNGFFGGQPEPRSSGRAVSSVVEHRLYTPAVTGSSPVPPTQDVTVWIDVRDSSFTL